MQIHMDRGRGEQSSSSQSRPCQNFLDEADRGEAQAIVNVLHLSQNTMSDMESGQSSLTGKLHKK